MRRILIALAAAMTAMVGIVAVASSPATAATNQFRGMNWAVLGDNFSTGPLVVQGLSQSDSNATVRAKANALYDDMASTMGVNTVRLPINTHTVAARRGGTPTGAPSTPPPPADSRSSSPTGRTAPPPAAGSRTSPRGTRCGPRVTNTYGSNTNVYFEPMNEPHGYSSAEWRNVAANWLSYHYSAVPGRVLIGGTGFSQDLRDICNDSRFNATLLSFHYYAFFYGAMTYDAFRSHIQTRLGNCASRAVATEFGAPDERRPQLRRREQHRQLRALHPRHGPGHARQPDGRHLLARPRRQAAAPSATTGTRCSPSAAAAPTST